jgi:hypothetical protein
MLFCWTLETISTITRAAVHIAKTVLDGIDNDFRAPNDFLSMGKCAFII